MTNSTRIYYHNRCLHFTQDVESLLVEDGIENAIIINKKDPFNDFDTIWENFLMCEEDHLVIRVAIEEGLHFLKKKFVLIQAGGGIVRNYKNEMLLIYRLGHWDLPKGKLEKGEDILTCAVREVREETGIQQIDEVVPFQTSYHFYLLKNEMVLKETFWYLMKTADSILISQEEEGIEKAVWVHENNLHQYFQSSYASIQHLIQPYLEQM